jgi:trehalose 6-phosphate synthase/phosphatase
MPRCLLVSNRLPLIYDKLKNNFETSSGGLVSAVKGLRSSEIGYDFEWLGFLTDEVPSEMQEALRGIRIGDHKCHPVMIEKGHATTWHYRNSPEAFAENLSHKLFIELKESLAAHPVKISRGKKSIEISSVNANKGSFIHHWLKRQEYQSDVIIAIGDDKTDEDMFDFLQNKSDFCPYCIKVGREKTNAHYSIKDQAQVNTLLKNLLHHI